MHWLCESGALGEAQSRGFECEGIKLFVVRREGRVYAYRNRCPHRGTALQWEADVFLDESASMIRCASHGALFLMDSGECVAGPCEGKELENFDCREDERGIWVQV